MVHLPSFLLLFHPRKSESWFTGGKGGEEERVSKGEKDREKERATKRTRMGNGKEIYFDVVGVFVLKIS